MNASDRFSSTRDTICSLPSDTAVRLGAPSKVVSSRALFRGDHEIGIDHEGALYRLKITRQGKLILNK